MTSDPVDRALKRYEDRAKRFVNSGTGKAILVGAVAGGLAGEIITGGVADALGLDPVDKVTHRVDRVLRKASWSASKVANTFNPGSELGAGALGFGMGRDFVDPWVKRDPREGISTSEPESDAFPSPNNPSRYITEDRALHFYKVYHKEIPDTGAEEKYQALGDELNRLVVEGSHDELVRKTAMQVTQGAQSTKEKAARVCTWFQQTNQYCYDEQMPYSINDPEVAPEWNGSLEVFQDARRTLEAGYHDCDCAVICIGAMLRSIGIYSFARLISQDDPEVYCHVFGVVPLEDGTEFVVDTTPVRDGEEWVFHGPGWECEPITGKLDVKFQDLPRA